MSKSFFTLIKELFTKNKPDPLDTEDHYEGELVNGVREGSGTMRFKNGNIYKGDWHNGVMHGIGEFIFADTCERYIGEFSDGTYNGQGIYHYSNGDVYEGCFINNKCNGNGTLTKANGDRCEGSWIGGALCGYGRYFYADGRVYRGMFFNNTMTDGFLTTKSENGDPTEVRFGEYVNAPKYPVLYLDSYPYENKMMMIKEIREITGYGLAMAKDIAENVPQILKTDVSRQDINDIMRRLAPLGATLRSEDRN
ncbi:MAG: ribosomal protein L7/L12 [Oscillospiraceae bacterium]|nr:ribosomal protein L7/L12 [Oscillospiraceae bacterium]